MTIYHRYQRYLIYLYYALFIANYAPSKFSAISARENIVRHMEAILRVVNT